MIPTYEIYRWVIVGGERIVDDEASGFLSDLMEEEEMKALLPKSGPSMTVGCTGDLKISDGDFCSAGFSCTLTANCAQDADTAEVAFELLKDTVKEYTKSGIGEMIDVLKKAKRDARH